MHPDEHFLEQVVAIGGGNAAPHQVGIHRGPVGLDEFGKRLSISSGVFDDPVALPSLRDRPGRGFGDGCGVRSALCNFAHTSPYPGVAFWVQFFRHRNNRHLAVAAVPANIGRKTPNTYQRDYRPAAGVRLRPPARR